MIKVVMAVVKEVMDGGGKTSEILIFVCTCTKQPLVIF